MPPALSSTHEHLAIEAELQAGSCRFVRERLRLPMGIEASFGWLRHPPSVLVVPETPDGQLVLLRRYRPAVGRWLLEFPAGTLMDGESAPAAAARLIQQLTGHLQGAWQELGVLHPNPGYSDERMTVGRITLGEAAGLALQPVGCQLDGAHAGGLTTEQRCSPQALEEILSSLEEAVDGRSVSAWLLARPHWSL
jgi:ADP-ribose pyrophosphatase